MRFSVYFQEPVYYCDCYLFGCGQYRDVRFVVTFFLEYYLSVNEGKESVILTYSDVVTGVVCCSALANDDAAGLYCLASEELDTKPFAF